MRWRTGGGGLSGRVARAMSWAWFRMVVSWAARVGSGGVVSEGGVGVLEVGVQGAGDVLEGVCVC